MSFYIIFFSFEEFLATSAERENAKGKIAIRGANIIITFDVI